MVFRPVSARPLRSMNEKQRPPDLNATDEMIAAFQGAESSHARAGRDLLWADFSDLTDEWTETIVETVTTPFLSEHGSRLERHEEGWILRYSKQCQVIDSLRPKILEITLPIVTNDKEGALFLAEVVLRDHKAPEQEPQLEE